MAFMQSGSAAGGGPIVVSLSSTKLSKRSTGADASRDAGALLLTSQDLDAIKANAYSTTLVDSPKRTESPGKAQSRKEAIIRSEKERQVSVVSVLLVINVRTISL